MRSTVLVVFLAGQTSDDQYIGTAEQTNYFRLAAAPVVLTGANGWFKPTGRNSLTTYSLILTRMGELLNFAVYNPSMLSDEDFLAGFVGRSDLIERMLQRLRETSTARLAKHFLILGQRGMGKTSLLRRLALAVLADPALSAVILPLTFREEQYNIHNLHIFWCNCLDALGDWFEKSEQMDKAAATKRR